VSNGIKTSSEGGWERMKKILAALGGIIAAIDSFAAIPGFGLNYGKNTLYVYEEFNCNPRIKNDQFFLSYFEYGITDWQSVTLQNISYADGSYYDLSVGIMQQLCIHDNFNLRGGASYVFGPGQNGYEDGMYYCAFANGKIYGRFGYIFQLGVMHTFDYKPLWGDAVYLTYDIIDERFTVYASMTSDFVNFEKSVDFSLGCWCILLQNKYGFKWISWYFDVGNVIERQEDVRISMGIDLLW
jgi:hypothetical protein